MRPAICNSQALFSAGAIENMAGTVNVLSSSLIDNNHSDYGGGIDSLGTVVDNSTLCNNHATGHNGGGSQRSGGVLIDPATGFMRNCYRHGLKDGILFLASYPPKPL